jgi:hypothetical protein
MCNIANNRLKLQFKRWLYRLGMCKIHVCDTINEITSLMGNRIFTLLLSNVQFNRMQFFLVFNHKIVPILLKYQMPFVQWTHLILLGSKFGIFTGIIVQINITDSGVVFFLSGKIRSLMHVTYTRNIRIRTFCKLRKNYRCVKF